MIEGVTKSGFWFKLDDEVVDDYDILEDLCEIDRGNGAKIPGILERILGKEQKEALKNHVRTETGRVPTSKMMEEMMEILTSNQNGKNS